MNNNSPLPYLIALVTLFLCMNVQAQSWVQLEKLDITNVEQHIGSAVKNKSVTGKPICVAGKTYELGIGVHAHSVLKLELNNSRRFRAQVGISDHSHDLESETISAIPLTDGTRIFYELSASSKRFIGVEDKDGKIDKGSAVFRLVHNGKEIFNSGIVRQGDSPIPIDLPLRKGILEMIVEDAGDGISGDHAVWIEPRIEFMEIAPVTVTPDYQGERIEMGSEVATYLNSRIAGLQPIELPLKQASFDWLIDNSRVKAEVYQAEDGKEIVLTNGLIARVFRVIPNLVTVDYMNLMTGESLLRAVSSEGEVVIDGKKFSIGGLSNQPEYGYTLKKWIDDLQITPNSFLMEDFEVKDLSDRMGWKQVRWAGNSKMPSGKELVFTLSKDGITAKVHFEMYDGIPTLGKWIEFINTTNILVQIDAFKVEQLAMVEGESLVDIPRHWQKPNIHIESDYAFGAMQQKTSDKTTHWVTDSRYTSQTNYPLQLPCILEVKPPLGPETAIGVGESLSTFRVWETPLDTRDEERKGLFIRKMYRTISPWTTENPIFLHLTSTKEDEVRAAVDQCAAVGYEMIILSFGSGLNMEREADGYYKRFKELREYANSKGIELGGYSLLSSRWISDEVDVINPETGKRGGMIFGSSPCLCSDWGYDYFRKIKKFFTETGMQVFEHDGSYPGNVCGSTAHTYHNGLGDSQWKQYAKIQELYEWMRSEGIYMNVPDFYVNSGTNKTGIGYREVNWSLPRERQAVLGRQNIYDGLWTRIPSMCWTFVPLTQYHGGGAAATMEPLKDHLKEYENQMMQNYGSGVQACYRGPRLFDAPETKELVERTILWYKKYREILNSDIIHLRRPSGRDWDGFLHVNPELKQKGLAMFFNPSDKDMTRQISLPLYYTGLSKTATLAIQDENPEIVTLSRDYNVEIEITIPAQGYQWLTIE